MTPEGTSAAAALREAAARFAAISDSPRLDAELLLAHAAGIERIEMLFRLSDLETPPDFAALADRRAAGEPLAYIVGYRDFWTIRLQVTPDVLIPRPDTETLMESAVGHFVDHPPARILDLGTGSGALLLAALDQWPQATGVGIDISPAALDVARDNARALGLAARAEFHVEDWADELEERFDLILANPPYIATDSTALGPGVLAHEPHGALFAGADGLDDYRRLAPAVPRLLAAGGLAAVEIGYDQGASAAALFRARDLDIFCRKDLSGLDRCLCVTHVKAATGGTG